MGVTLERLRSVADASKYPVHVLDGCESALVLFAAGFHGVQDAVHIADAGMTATCVDTDHEKLEEMEQAYPAGWEYVTDDVFEYATRTDRRWDVVSIDCPSNLFDQCANWLPVWCLLARQAVVLGTGSPGGMSTPPGWKWTGTLWRSTFQGGVFWAVIEPC